MIDLNDDRPPRHVSVVELAWIAVKARLNGMYADEGFIYLPLVVVGQNCARHAVPSVARDELPRRHREATIERVGAASEVTPDAILTAHERMRHEAVDGILDDDKGRHAEDADLSPCVLQGLIDVRLSEGHLHDALDIIKPDLHGVRLIEVRRASRQREPLRRRVRHAGH